MLKMIKFNLKNRTLLILITTVVFLAIGFALYLGDDFLKYFYFYNRLTDQHFQVIGPDSSPIIFITIMACILCTIIPIIEFSFKMSKISIDQMYSLPIKREKLYLAKFISGFIEVLIPVCVVFIFCLLKVLFSNHMYETIYFLPYFACLILFMFFLYSTITFFFTRGNTVIDGIINVVLIIFVVELFSSTIDSMLWGNIRNYFDSGSCYLYSPISIISELFDNKLSAEAINKLHTMYDEYYYTVRVNLTTYEIVSVIIFILIGIGSTILFVLLNKKDKAEDSMQVSNSWFSYKVFIPVYMSLISLLMMDGSELIGFVFLFVGTYIAYVIYRRSLKIKKWDIIVPVICFVSMIIIYIVLDNLRPNPYACNDYGCIMDALLYLV